MNSSVKSLPIPELPPKPVLMGAGDKVQFVVASSLIVGTTIAGVPWWLTMPAAFYMGICVGNRLGRWASAMDAWNKLKILHDLMQTMEKANAQRLSGLRERAEQVSPPPV